MKKKTIISNQLLFVNNLEPNGLRSLNQLPRTLCLLISKLANASGIHHRMKSVFYQSMNKVSIS